MQTNRERIKEFTKDSFTLNRFCKYAQKKLIEEKT